MVHATSVIKGLTHDGTCSIKRSLRISSARFYCCCFFSFHGLCWFFLGLCWFFLCMLLFHVYHIFIRHPRSGALMVFGIARLCHHHIIHLLLWSCIGWWFVTYIVSFVSWQILRFNIGTVQLS